ncbi:hypothetical protein AVEN_264482-1 [Araneus ventricosus]|uniref:Uncharacterized protein n=1 Tax=Araneus ventricosus TaxID=182803 RepID=A0A4Y2M1S1_ARAVE|nr:hypothetical protein AVEN_264481-1 [Araneus ventricosus]GBN20709.1 hypothetical protein AVEN_264482-1 [Araneus ventricosus]
MGVQRVHACIATDKQAGSLLWGFRSSHQWSGQAVISIRPGLSTELIAAAVIPMPASTTRRLTLLCGYSQGTLHSPRSSSQKYKCIHSGKA